MKRWIPWTVGLSITALLSIAYWAQPQTLHRLELLFQNVHFQLRGPVQAGPEVVVAAIDEKSIDQLGRWPWPRSVIAKLVDKLVQHQVKVIGFDMVFSSPDDSSGKQNLIIAGNQLKDRMTNPKLVDQVLGPMIQNADNDGLLADALRASHRSVLGYFFHFGSQGLDHLSQEERHNDFLNIKSTRFNGFIKSEGGMDFAEVDFKTGHAVESNISSISKSIPHAGFFNFLPEPDGSLRRVPVIVRYKDEVDQREYFFPPLSIRILEQYVDGSILFRVGPLGAEKVILQGDQDFEIPVNDIGELLVNFLGPGPVFPHVSITDILHDRTDQYSLETLKDKIVIVGATAPALGDIKVSPFDPVYPGVEIQGTIVDNVLHQKLLHQPRWIGVFDGIYILLMGVLLTFVFSKIKPARGIFVCVLVAGGQFLFSHWIFVSEGFWVTDIYPFFQNILIFSALMLCEYLHEKRNRHIIKNVFSKYMSPEVVEKLLLNPEQLNLGGEQRELTAFFTDLANFTTFSEQLSASGLVNHLNEYFSEMTDILIRHNGTLDKYDGDAIKAFFGAPVYFEDHARRACWVALEMQQRLAAMRKQWARENKPQLEMRIGINTGMMVVGNMGSDKRMNYGMNGDSVNLAARLEGVNKQYGTFMVISESTYNQARDSIEVRELDWIRVVGRVTPVKIYELLGKKGEVEPSIRPLLPIYSQGLTLYQAGQWEEAMMKFKEVLQIKPDDGPSHTMIERCQYLLENNPTGKDWEGVFSMQSK